MPFTTPFDPDHGIDYRELAPRLYNMAQGLGLPAKRIHLASALCADEEQGYIQLLLTKHFGVFPTDLAHSDGTLNRRALLQLAAVAGDIVIVQASHVGYDLKRPGYSRCSRVDSSIDTQISCCLSVSRGLEWYSREYRFAQRQIRVRRGDDGFQVIIDNELLDQQRNHGLFLNLPRLIATDGNGGILPPIAMRSTSQVFATGETLSTQLTDDQVKGDEQIIGARLGPAQFRYRPPPPGEDIQGRIMTNLADDIQQIVTADNPMVSAAQANLLAEFDHNCRFILKQEAFNGRRIIYLAGLNLDIVGDHSLHFPRSRFIPWAAYIQKGDNHNRVLEQEQALAELRRHSSDNPDQLNIDAAIGGD